MNWPRTDKGSVPPSEAMHALELASRAAHGGKGERAEALLEVARVLAREEEASAVADLGAEVRELLLQSTAPPIRLSGWKSTPSSGPLTTEPADAGGLPEEQKNPLPSMSRTA